MNANERSTATLHFVRTTLSVQAYTEAADRRSTLSMLSLFAEVWPEFPQYPVPTNACGTVLGQAIALPAAKL